MGLAAETFFVDRSLGRHTVVNALRAAGFEVVAHDDEFSQDTPDVEWLGTVARRGWIVLTKDSAIRRNPLERAAIIGSGSRVFVITNRHLIGTEMADLLVGAASRMGQLARETTPPFVFRIDRNGTIARLAF